MEMKRIIFVLCCRSGQEEGNPERGGAGGGAGEAGHLPHQAHLGDRQDMQRGCSLPRKFSTLYSLGARNVAPSEYSPRIFWFITTTTGEAENSKFLIERSWQPRHLHLKTFDIKTLKLFRTHVLEFS